MTIEFLVLCFFFFWLDFEKKLQDNLPVLYSSVLKLKLKKTVICRLFCDRLCEKVQIRGIVNVW